MFLNTQHGGVDIAAPDLGSNGGEGAPRVASRNRATGCTAVGPAHAVYVAGAVAHNLLAVTPQTHADDAEALPGVSSRTVRGPARHVDGVATVLVAGSPATRLGSPSIHNGANSDGARVTPSQRKVLVLGR